MMFFSPRASNSQAGLWQALREDVMCVFARDPAARNLLEVLLVYPGVHALILYRVAHVWWLADWKLAARLLSAFCRWLTNIDIHPGASIGRRFFIDHGAGVVIGETAEVGDDVTLYHGVTLGGTSWNQVKRHPTLGNNVLVGAGAKILGAISIGNNVRVGANSVVVKDVPACCTVIGIPGRVIQNKGIKIQSSRGIDLDHNVPDPVGRALSCFGERLDELEQAHRRLVLSREEDCAGCDAQDVCHEHALDLGLRQAAGGE